MSNVNIAITKGVYRGATVTGTFPLIKGYVDGARGGFVTIKNVNHAPNTPVHQRVHVEQNDFKLVDDSGNDLPANALTVVSPTSTAVVTVDQNFETLFTESESEEAAMTRIEETFAMLDKITDACAAGSIRGLIISGPPGVGKSFGVERQLDVANMFRKIEGKDPLYEIISGGVSAIGLYQKLYHNRSSKQVLVFDDADEIFSTDESLNLLKAALNSGERRRICWNKESRVLLTDDIPNSFDFEGSIIFLSNIDFERSIAKASRIAGHLSALMSRCHYLDLRINSMRDKILRIKQIIASGMLDSYQFTPGDQQSIIDFIVRNSGHLREVNLRVVKKLADFVKIAPGNWYTLAEATLLTREALFKRLLTEKQRKMENMGAVMA